MSNEKTLAERIEEIRVAVHGWPRGEILLARIAELEARNEELRKQIRRVHAYDHMQKVCGAPMPVRACNEDPCDICRQSRTGEGPTDDHETEDVRSLRNRLTAAEEHADRISVHADELAAENEALRKNLKLFDGACVVHERKCWDLIDGHIALRDCACQSCRRVLGGGN